MIDHGLFDLHIKIDNQQVHLTLRIMKTIDALRSGADEDIYSKRVPLVWSTEEKKLQRLLRCKKSIVVNTILKSKSNIMEKSFVDYFLNDEKVFHSLLVARKKLYAQAMSYGHIFVLCPWCRDHELTYDLNSFSQIFGTASPEYFDPDIGFILPHLHAIIPKGNRPENSTLTKHIRFSLPSSYMDMDTAIPLTEGYLCSVDMKKSQQVIRAWAMDDSLFDNLPDDHPYWNLFHRKEENKGFRAIANISKVIRDVKDSSAVPLDIVEQMPYHDFLFLDTLYYLTHNISIAKEENAQVTCRKCNKSFLPVMDTSNLATPVIEKIDNATSVISVPDLK